MTELKIENASVIWVPEHECVKLKCRGFLSYQQVVYVTGYAFEMIQHYNLCKCIVNLQESKGYPQGAEEYLRDIWYPRMAAAGVCRIAFVVSESIFGRASMLVVHAGEAIMKIERQYFADEESAGEWLNT
jgi:hypothetical protein